MQAASRVQGGPLGQTGSAAALLRLGTATDCRRAARDEWRLSRRPTSRSLHDAIWMHFLQALLGLSTYIVRYARKTCVRSISGHKSSPLPLRHNPVGFQHPLAVDGGLCSRTHYSLPVLALACVREYVDALYLSLPPFSLLLFVPHRSRGGHGRRTP
ncbi:hypothetical protein GGR56DRAFT_66343 [Xylariaceae sp. FL0804]|nr:hypothetical protein GGR56DRAFT_66343 [Xylariaceae sp. FL0804]